MLMVVLVVVVLIMVAIVVVLKASDLIESSVDLWKKFDAGSIDPRFMIFFFLFRQVPLEVDIFSLLDLRALCQF